MLQSAVSISQGTARHKLEFLIGDHELPYNMTVYQAVKQFSTVGERDGSETDTDSEHPYGHAGKMTVHILSDATCPLL